MRGRSKHRGYGPRGTTNGFKNHLAAIQREHRYFGKNCRTTLAARNGEDFSAIPVEWCNELMRVSRIVSEKMEMWDTDECADFAVYSVLKVLSDIYNRGERPDANKLFSICYAYCEGVMKSIRTSRNNLAKYDGGMVNPETGAAVYDFIIDENAARGLSERAQLLLHTAIEYATTHNADRELTYTTKGNIRVRSTLKNDELSLFTVARLHLGWASSTASRVVNELRDNFFPNYCLRMEAF